MLGQMGSANAAIGAHVPSDRAERVFVTAVWVLASVAAFAYTAWFGRNVPYMDDWVLVPTLSGAQPFGLPWLFEQTLEHRYVMGKALIYAIWQVSGGDFRATLWATDALLVAISYAFLRAARAVRGHSEWSDAFFPLVVLNWGNYESLLLFVQLWFVLPVALFVATMLIMVSGAWKKRSGALALCACIALLPLNGAIGVLYAPPLVLLLVWMAWNQRAQHAVAGPFAFAAVAAMVLSALYFVGYHTPAATQRVSRTPLGVIDSVFEVLSVAFGPGGASLWPYSGIAVALLGVAGATLCMRALREGGERPRAAALLACIAATGLIALGVGYGRSGLGPGAGFPGRYALLVAPGLGACALAASLYAGRIVGRLVPMVLFLCACSMIALDGRAGVVYGQGRAVLADAFLGDLAADATTRSLALRYAPRIYPHRDQLQQYLDMLRVARVGPYSGAPAQALAAPPPCHAVSVPLRVAEVHETDFDGEAGRSFGDDPFVAFALPGPMRVCGVEVRYAVDNGADKAATQAFWKLAAAGQNFDPLRRNITLTQATGPQTATFWIDQAIDHFRFDPDTRPGTFRISGITFFVPD